MGLWDNDNGNQGGVFGGFGSDAGAEAAGDGVGAADRAGDAGVEPDAVESEAPAAAGEPDGGEDGGRQDKPAKRNGGLPKLKREQAKRYGALWEALGREDGREVARQLAGVSTDDAARLFALLAELKLDGLPKLDGQQARRFRELWDLLGTDEGVAVAKLLASSNSPLPEALVEALTETKTRNAVREWSDRLKRLHSDDVLDMQLDLSSAFTEDRDLAAQMFRLFASVGADVGRASGVPRKDARTLGVRWGEGVDLSIVDRMRV